jgi:hypothetical protein
MHWSFGLRKPQVAAPRHFSYRPAHRVTLQEHGPGVPSGFVFEIPFEIPTSIGSACREGVAPRGWIVFPIQHSRS